MESTPRERRGFFRLDKTLLVDYRFVPSRGSDAGFKKWHKGRTKNVSTSGILLVGKMPNPEWIGDLLTHKINVALVIRLAGKGRAIKAIGRLAWLDVTLSEEQAQYEMGVFFNDMMSADKEKLTRFIIESLI